jgi:hypothetical protein
MSIQPQAIDYAFHTLYYGGQDEPKRVAFTQRWGSFSDETFVRALTAGTPEEKTLAIFALARSDHARVDELLHACVKSNKPMERWASVLALGERRDEHVLPLLAALLDEFLPPQMHPLEREGGLYHAWRLKVASLLGEWGHTDQVPILRLALIRAWELEQAEPPETRYIWHPYQDELIYALGRLEAFGVLTHLTLPKERQQLWMVLLACGSLQARQHYGDLLTQIQINQTLKMEVAQALERRFGLTANERGESIEGYADAYFARSE